MNLQELAKLHGFKPDGILHVGAGNCEEAELYVEMGVKPVIWVEALPPDKTREERAAKYDQTLYEQTPLSDQSGDVTFNVVSNSVSSSILPLKRHSELYPDLVVTNSVIVQAHRADEFFAGKFPKDINTLVLDVQGAELKVLKGMGMMLDQIKRIWTEVNLKELYEGCVLEPELRDWLAKHGFGNWEFYPVHLEEWGEAFVWR